ncbi:hypothetical protein GCM10011403_09750 [Pseudohongiella nitratireducens]|uniref:Uncharacterized protein n=1 Tax=Pseudohongiella nitratireducens TaxID=1768907 RepID=A0A917GRR5_9GAMM|nr:DUF4175 family protein [Pseudohongiella nitratireducens]GGG54696.1 hypothetical protein GCM10011403_09750 [Pseudohongiella nitratireducens]
MGISTDTDVESGHQVGQMRVTLAGLRRRQWLLALFVHIAVAAGVLLLGLTALAVLASALPSGPLWTALLISLWIILLLGTVTIVTARLIRTRADDQAIVRQIEKELPDFEQRILTSMEFSSTDDLASRGVSRRFVEKLWEDAEDHLKQRHELIQRQVSDSRAPLLIVGLAAAGSLTLVMSLLSVEFLRLGAGRIVWPFAGPATPDLVTDATPALPVNLAVEPGAMRLQRGDPANISVRIENAIPTQVTLWVQGDQVNWRELPMQEQGAGSDSAVYGYELASVEDDMRYYVTASFSAGVADPAQSQEFDISVFDLPRAEQIDLAFDYPDYTGQEDDSSEDTGDALVPEGTEVAMQLQFNKPVASAFLRLEDGSELPVNVDGDTGEVTLTAETDMSYQVFASDFEQLQSEDPEPWYIRVIPDMPPELALISPGRDQDVMPLEEVVLAIDASDDYGLTAFDLHYSVIGSEEQRVNFLPEPGLQNVSGNQLVYLEDLQVQPGDFVSYYLTLSDNNGLDGPQEVVSDIYFLQVIPTDQVFRESAGGQQGGGGMGGNDSSSALVTLQKDIIAATWRLRQQQAELSAEQFSDDVAVVATSQREAMERASMSIDRLSERLNFADDSYGNAVTYLQQAIEQMELAATDLDGEALTSAMAPEQQALQYVLRAEAEINETDVNFQRTAGGGGGGGQQQEREDLRELFDMEMGQNENRYENPRQAGQSQQASEEASRLEQLARRQEGLSQAQRNLSRRLDQMSEEEQRRELERLRREQEQLTQELAQLEQQMSRRRQAQGNQSGQQPSSPANSQGGQQGGQNDGLAQVRQALQQMQDASEAATPSQAAARSQRAAESLRQQQQQLASEGEQAGNQLVQSLAQRAEALRQQQQSLQSELQDLNRQQGVGQSRQSSMNNEDVQRLLSERQRQQQELESLEEMLRAVIARAGNDEQALIRQAQEANRAIRSLEERMEASGRVLRNGMVNLAVDIEEEVDESMQSLSQQLQALQPGAPGAGQQGQSALQQVAGDASELRNQLEALREALQNNGQQGQQGQPGTQNGESVADMRERLARSQQLAQQVREQLDPQAQQQGAGTQRGQRASQSRQPGSQTGEQPGGQRGEAAAQAGTQADSGNAGQTARGGQQGEGMPQQPWQGPQFGDAALWGNARSVSDEISQQSIEDFLSQPELLESILTPLVELESQLRAAAELSAVSQRLFNVSEEDIPERYRDQIEDYYRALSENGGSAQ